MKKLFSLALSLTLVAGILAGCGSTKTDSSASASGSSNEPVTLTIGATPTPHAEILQQVVEPLKEEGIELEIVEFTDYVAPNTALEDGSIDANYFQHQPYLDQFCEQNGADLISIAKIHYEPLGIYPGTVSSLDEIPDGAAIAVPNDVTNEARALQLLEANGVFTLKENAGLNATKLDIVDNPKNVEIMEVESAQIASSLPDVALGVINSNFAMQADLNPATDTLAIEESTSEAAQTYGNIIAIRAEDKENEAILKLVEALQSQAIKDYIDSTYSGSVVPIF